MKVFYDSEFTGLHKNTTLISLAFVSDSGAEFYAEFIDYDLSQVDEWLKLNVIDKLLFKDLPDGVYAEENFLGSNDVYIKGNKSFIKRHLTEWFKSINSNDESIEIWSDCLSFDWVLFCDLYNGAFNIPKDIYYIPFDICTLFKIKEVNPDISREFYVNVGKQINNSYNDVGKHVSLYDARIIKSCYERLINTV